MISPDRRLRLGCQSTGQSPPIVGCSLLSRPKTCPNIRELLTTRKARGMVMDLVKVIDDQVMNKKTD